MIGENREIEAWVVAGRSIKLELISAMHGELDPRSLDEAEIREWQATGRQIEKFVKDNYARVGKWIAEKGWTPEQAVEEIQRGVRPPWASSGE